MIDYQGYPSKIKKLLALLSIGASKSSLITFVDISEPTLERYLRSLREDWDCAIEYDRITKLYTLTDSGRFTLTIH